MRAALLPLIAWGLTLVALVVAPVAFIGGLVGRALSVVVVVLAGMEWRRWSKHLRSAWFRAEWRWAARSAGLAMITEANIDTDHDPGDKHVEAVPSLIRLTIGKHGARTYIVRPLPSQTIDQYTRAAASLALRWRCENVTVERSTGRRGRGLIVLTVNPGGALDRPVDFVDAGSNPRTQLDVVGILKAAGFAGRGVVRSARTPRPTLEIGPLSCRDIPMGAAYRAELFARHRVNFAAGVIVVVTFPVILVVLRVLL